jgi:hypothetical protein
MKSNFKYFDDEHLTDEGLALVSEAYSDGNPTRLPEDVLEHIESCESCKLVVVDYVEFVGPTNVRARNPKTLFYSLAALLLVFFVAGALIKLWPGATLDYKSVFVEEFQAYPDIITSKDDLVYSKSGNILQYKGMAFYNAKQYDSAIVAFKNGLELTKANDTIRFYLANSYLALGDQNKNAIPILINLADSKSSFANPSEWLLALAYLNQNDKTKCIAILQNIATTNGFYKEKAIKLLDMLSE